ncbi:MAG TPA: flap endonuclease, partial [Acidimicrobiales bacterium]
MGLQVHLVDGTYELFRYYYALPDHINGEGMDVAATRGVVGTCLTLLEEGATHVGVATDHVIESFRNDLWPTYKDGSGVDPVLKA